MRRFQRFIRYIPYSLILVQTVGENTIVNFQTLSIICIIFILNELNNLLEKKMFEWCSRFEMFCKSNALRT